MGDTLDLTILRTLAAAAHLGGFGRAADRVGRTQSAVSLQLRRLEAQLGRKLFMKSGRGLVPTEAGEVLLAYAVRLLALNDEALEAVRGQGLSGRVRVGVPQDIADTILPDALARFARAHPEVLLEGRVERQDTLTRLLREGAIDLALIFADERPPEGQDLGQVAMTWVAGPRLASAGGSAGAARLTRSPVLIPQACAREPGCGGIAVALGVRQSQPRRALAVGPRGAGDYSAGRGLLPTGYGANRSPQPASFAEGVSSIGVQRNLAASSGEGLGRGFSGGGFAKDDLGRGARYLWNRWFGAFTLSGILSIYHIICIMRHLEGTKAERRSMYYIPPSRDVSEPTSAPPIAPRHAHYF